MTPKATTATTKATATTGEKHAGVRARSASNVRALHVLRDLHAEVDALAADLARAHRTRLHCARGCSGCCSDDLTVLPIEAARITVEHSELLAQGEPHPQGACAFLDAAGACRIYEHRPYVCRTQGLPLRWLEEDEHDEIVELRDICPLNAEGPALDEVPEDACWLIGPFEERLLDAQAEHDPDAGDGSQRVALRSLFLRK